MKTAILNEDRLLENLTTDEHGFCANQYHLCSSVVRCVLTDYRRFRAITAILRAFSPSAIHQSNPDNTVAAPSALNIHAFCKT
jgi:hypothetical protein